MHCQCGVEGSVTDTLSNTLTVNIKTSQMRKLLLLLGLWFGSLAAVNAQVREVTGRIVDTSGIAIPFATIQVKGTKIASVADADGNFVIKAAPGAILVVSSSG